MKRFIKKVAFFLVFCFVIAVLPSYLIDPYNVFHWEHIRNNGVEPNKNYIKTKYILKNPDKYDGFLFGSSRVGSIHVENIDGEKIYNMTCSAGIPREHLETLKTFLENNVKIEAVYMGVDSLSYTEDPKEHYFQQMRCPYQQLDLENLVNLYIDPYMVIQSLPVILNNTVTITKDTDAFYEYGWWCDYGKTATIDWSQANAVIGTSYLLDDALQDIQEIKDICEANHIELVVFTNPMYEITHNKSVEMNYMEFLKRLAGITDYYNFSGINDVTINTDNYLDTSHYNAYVGDLLINVMCNQEKYDDLYAQGFGWYVTESNVDELLDILS